MNKLTSQFLPFLTIFLLTINNGMDAFGQKDACGTKSYLDYVSECVDILINNGTDTYGEITTPMLVSILDVETLTCPPNPRKLDEYFRVSRRERRNPAGSNLLTDQPTLKSIYCLSEIRSDKRYSEFADQYIHYVLKNLVDKDGFFWWGWHRHYDVYKDIMDGHAGNPHEIHAIHCIDWENLWRVNPDAVSTAINAIWEYHVINKNTGEVNRHGDGERGCDFSMSAGAYIESFVFLYQKTGDKKWIDRAKRITGYYWGQRDQKTNLFPERPNAGLERFDGSSFVTSITGLYCHSLLKAYELTSETEFRDQAVAYLQAYAKYGYDDQTGKFWGALNLDGNPIPGPRISEGYAAYEPRGHLDLWDPYVAGYQYAIYTAQAFVYAYQVTQKPEFLIAAKQFATWIQNTPPETVENENTWYEKYSNNEGKMGTYAGKYGRTISFYLHLYVVTGDEQYLRNANHFADTAIGKLFKNGLFKGHPAKPYYEAMDGVGYLLYALIQLDEITKHPEQILSQKKILLGKDSVAMPLDNW